MPADESELFVLRCTGDLAEQDIGESGSAER